MKPVPFSSDYYDSTRQARVWWEAVDAQSTQHVNLQREILKSRLRFDFLFAPSVSLSRADVLDGTCFMHTSPQEVREWLGVGGADAPPLTIRTRSGSLLHDLLGWVKPANSSSLHPELWLVIPPHLRDVYAREFPKRKASDIQTAKDLARAIGATVNDQELGEQLEHYWATWIRQQALLEVKKVDWSKPDYHASLSSLDQQSLTSSERQAYSAAVEAFLGGVITRGELIVRLERDAPALLIPVNAAIAKARAEADGTKHEVITNTCLSQSIYGWLLKGVSHDPAVQCKSVDIALPVIFPEWLVTCDYCKLRSQTWRWRKKWLAAPSVDSLKGLTDAIVDVMSSESTALPNPSARVQGIVRVLALAAGSVPVVVRLCTSGLDAFAGIAGIPAAVAAALEVSGKTQDYVRRGVQFLARRHIRDQVVQTFRLRKQVND